MPFPQGRPQCSLERRQRLLGSPPANVPDRGGSGLPVLCWQQPVGSRPWGRGGTGLASTATGAFGYPGRSEVCDRPSPGQHNRPTPPTRLHRYGRRQWHPTPVLVRGKSHGRMPLRGEGSCGGGGAPRDSAGSGARLLHPWDFPRKSTGVGCHCLLPYLCTSLPK